MYDASSEHKRATKDTQCPATMTLTLYRTEMTDKGYARPTRLVCCKVHYVIVRV